MGPKTYMFRGFYVTEAIFWWPKPLLFMVLGAHGGWLLNQHLVATLCSGK